MLVKQVKKSSKVAHNIKMDEELNRSIEQYQEFYLKQFGEPIQFVDLVEEILKAALGKDRDFKKFIKEQSVNI